MLRVDLLCFMVRRFGDIKNTKSLTNYLDFLLKNAFFTLRLHFNYVKKTMVMCPNRLPHILATYIIENNLAWAKEWPALKHILMIKY